MASKAKPAFTSYQARLDSFAVKKARRPSARSKKTAQNAWPLQYPSAHDLAFAGFVWKPTSASPDNVQCFSCSCQLDGWEESDVPAHEHLTHSPSCGFAINVCIRMRQSDPDRVEKDPLSAEMRQARIATFADYWPLDTAAGYPSVDQVVDAGWYYDPAPDAPDSVSCAYCSLSLSDWEPHDDPLDEHYKRNTSCHFFVLKELYHPVAIPWTKSSKRKSQVTEPKATRGKRSSSRASTARNAAPEVEAKAPAPAKKTRGKKSAAKTVEYEHEPEPEPEPVYEPEPEMEPSPEPAMSIDVPDFPLPPSKKASAKTTRTKTTVEVKVPKTRKGASKRASTASTASTRQTRGTKRTSEHMDTEEDLLLRLQAEIDDETNELHTSIQSSTPPTKPKAAKGRRGTKRKSESMDAEIELLLRQQAELQSEGPSEPSEVRSSKRTRLSNHDEHSMPSISSLPESAIGSSTPHFSTVIPDNTEAVTPPRKKSPIKVWEPIDIDAFFSEQKDNTLLGVIAGILIDTRLDKENFPDMMNEVNGDVAKLVHEVTSRLTEEERRMSVEQWVMYNANRGEEKLRAECEKLIAAFEAKGLLALAALDAVPVAG